MPTGLPESNADMEGYIIRRMEKGDTKELAELDKLCFSVPWSEQAFVDETENNLACYFVAVDGENVIGYIGYWKIIDEGHITNIAVSPDYRRRGIAANMLSQAIKSAYDEKLSLLTLEVRKSNSSARALYEKFGFEALGERKNYYHSPTEDAIIMTLMLGDN